MNICPPVTILPGQISTYILVQKTGTTSDHSIDYTHERFEDVTVDMDVVFNTVCGETFQRAFQTLKKKGFMVTVVAFPDDEGKRYNVDVARSSTVPSAKNLAAIKQLVEAGQVKPHIDVVLPLAEIKAALALSESGRALGKIVLTAAA